MRPIDGFQIGLAFNTATVCLPLSASAPARQNSWWLESWCWWWCGWADGFDYSTDKLLAADYKTEDLARCISFTGATYFLVKNGFISGDAGFWRISAALSTRTIPDYGNTDNPQDSIIVQAVNNDIRLGGEYRLSFIDLRGGRFSRPVRFADVQSSISRTGSTRALSWY